MHISIKNFIQMCMETSLQGIYHVFECISTEVENEMSSVETSNEKSDCSEDDAKLEAKNASRRYIISRYFDEPDYPSNYHLLLLRETKFFESLIAKNKINYPHNQRNNQRNRRSLRRVETDKKTIEMLTPVEVSKYILSFSCREIPVVNFIKLCYQGLSKILESEEKELVNLIVSELKDIMALDVQVNQLTKMTQFIKLIKKTFLPPINLPDCVRKMKNICMTGNENISDYIARFQQLHTIILDHEIDSKQASNIDDIIKKIEYEHLQLFLKGIDNMKVRKDLNVFCFCYTDLNSYLKELVSRNVIDYEPRIKLAVSKDQAQPQFNEMLKLSIYAPTINEIRGIELDEQTSRIGMLTSKEAAEFIPYFNGFEPSIYNFVEACYIALSNIAIGEEHKLVSIIISRLQSKAAECTKWIIIHNLHDLMKILMGKFEYDNDLTAFKKMRKLHMEHEESIHDFVTRFKKLHVVLLIQKLMSNINLNKTIKEIIGYNETLHLIKFIKALEETSFTPNFIYYGFHDFIEKVEEEYVIFEKQKQHEPKINGSISGFSGSEITED